MAKKKIVQSRNKKKTQNRTGNTEANGVATQYIELSRLLLDGANPRLGAKAGEDRTQSEILDAVVDIFGVDDVLSSLAVNGYFDAEPMVGVSIDGTDNFRIAEGNRRLAACLILVGDKRAMRHKKRTEQFQLLQKEHNNSPITSVPVRILSDGPDLLSYLGVRHIAASQPWDSFAKAAWIAKVLDESQLSLKDVTEMIGDQHSTVARALEGYYFVKQLVDTAHFVPGDSNRAGRGSNPAYPFSWVYTTLGYGPVREWLNLEDVSRTEPRKTPLKNESLEDAGALMTFLFGNKSQSRSASINDSREISDLARAIANPESRRQLKRGKTVQEVAKLLKPAKERVAESLFDSQESLQNALAPLSQGEVTSDESTELIEPSKKVRSLAIDVHKRITELFTADGE